MPGVMKAGESMDMLRQSGLRPPRTLTIAITGACNLKCCHCWVKAEEASSPAHMPLRDLRRLVREFAVIGGEGIRITGGEPLCHPQWLALLKYASSLGFKAVILQTNAMLMSDDHIAELCKLDFPGLSIQISLDGVVARTHDLVRGEGAFSGAMQAITRLVQAGLADRISIFFTEMRHNLHEIPELLELADSLGIGSVSSGAMVLCGRASESSLVAPPGVEQYLSLLGRYDRDANFRRLYGKIGSMAAVEWRTDTVVRQECCTFVENPYLTPSGRLYPCLLCHTDEYAVTGVYEKGLATAFAEGAQLWSFLLRISRSRADAIAECRDCPGKLLCAGGCMGRAWGSCGNLMTADDRCKARRTIYQQVSAARH